jgi:hypothetical protein
MADELTEPIEQWTAKRRMALVLRIVKEETSVEEAARQHALTVAAIEERRDPFLAGAENAESPSHAGHHEYGTAKTLRKNVNGGRLYFTAYVPCKMQLVLLDCSYERMTIPHHMRMSMLS